jgi:hypothetical protein
LCFVILRISLPVPTPGCATAVQPSCSSPLPLAKSLHTCEFDSATGFGAVLQRNTNSALQLILSVLLNKPPQHSAQHGWTIRTGRSPRGRNPIFKPLNHLNRPAARTFRINATHEPETATGATHNPSYLDSDGSIRSNIYLISSAMLAL